METHELDRFLRELQPEEKSASGHSTDIVENEIDYTQSSTVPGGVHEQDPYQNNLDNSVYFYDPRSNSSTRPTSKVNTAEFIGINPLIPQYLRVSPNFRYRTVEPHRHEFIEINYMYSGRCTNIVNGTRFSMAAGDILIMDTNCSHSVGWTYEDDILINILILSEFFDSALSEIISGESILSDFLVNATSQMSGQPNYLYFKTDGSPKLHDTIRNMLCEYFDPNAAYADTLINCYVREIFILLMRLCAEEPDNVMSAYDPNSTVSSIISYIKDNCVTCTRDSVAERFGYSPNYLSQMLSNSTGKSFVPLRNEFRLLNVEQKLNTTSVPVKDVAEEYGFNNATHFYKLYKDFFGKYPRSKETQGNKGGTVPACEA